MKGVFKAVAAVISERGQTRSFTQAVHDLIEGGHQLVLIHGGHTEKTGRIVTTPSQAVSLPANLSSLRIQATTNEYENVRKTSTQKSERARGW